MSIAEARRKLLARSCEMLESGVSIEIVKKTVASASIADLWFVVENLQTHLVEAKTQNCIGQRTTSEKEDHPHDLAAMAAEYVERAKRREEERLANETFWKESNKEWEILFANETHEKTNQESMRGTADLQDSGAYHGLADDTRSVAPSPVQGTLTPTSSISREKSHVYSPSQASLLLKSLFSRA
jgi:hypothetical protein